MLALIYPEADMLLAVMLLAVMLLAEMAVKMAIGLVTEVTP